MKQIVRFNGFWQSSCSTRLPVHATIIMENEVSAEVHFAQKLAANEKKIRDKAIKRLSRYLSVRSSHGS